ALIHAATLAERIRTALTALRELHHELPAPHPPLHGLHVAPNTLVNRYTGEVLGGATSTRWSKVNIRDEYEEGLGTAVVLENLARHAAYAQYGALESPPPRNLLHVSLSFGVALGQVLDGRIISGAHGGAGELGHVSIDSNGPVCRCSNRGCLFTYAGADTVLEECRIVTGTPLSLDEAIDLALAGDDRVVSIFSRAGAAVGMALNSVCNLLDPDLILIGGHLSRAGDVILDPLRDALFRNALPLFGRDLRIEPAVTLSDQALVHASLRALRLDVDLAAAVLAAHDPAAVAIS
ncbi:MAG: ROK family protein, partial [Brachybacterium sp.]|nr:ROK family protein [Brachybacterium sp.]